MDDKKRRVAVCLSGIPKYCNNSIESIKKPNYFAYTKRSNVLSSPIARMAFFG